jgi:hypothetical protein
MQHYNSIQQLIENYNNLPYPGRIYIEGEKKIIILNLNFGYCQVRKQKINI